MSENAEEILKCGELVDANRVSARKEMYSALARYTNSESSTIARSVVGLDRVEDSTHITAEEHWEEHSERNVSACIQNPAQDVSQVRRAIMQWEEVESYDF